MLITKEKKPPNHKIETRQKSDTFLKVNFQVIMALNKIK